MKSMSTLILPATLEHLGAFISSVTKEAEAAGASPQKILDIELALEEALVNIVEYAYKGEKGDIEVVSKSDRSGVLVVEIIDKGVPFDVTVVPQPDINAELSERKVGGLGIYFMKKVMDYVGYRREGDKNILEMRIQVQ